MRRNSFNSYPLQPHFLSSDKLMIGSKREPWVRTCSNVVLPLPDLPTTRPKLLGGTFMEMPSSRGCCTPGGWKDSPCTHTTEPGACGLLEAGPAVAAALIIVPTVRGGGCAWATVHRTAPARLLCTVEATGKQGGRSN